MSTIPSQPAVPASPDTAETGALRLVGELDLASSADFDRLERAVGASAGSDVDVDISEVTFVDASALGALVRMRLIAAERGGALTLVGARPRVRRTFRLARVDGLLDDRPGS